MDLVGFEGFIAVFLLLPNFPHTWFVVLLVFVILVNLEKKKAATVFLCSFLIWFAISRYMVTTSH